MSAWSGRASPRCDRFDVDSCVPAFFCPLNLLPIYSTHDFPQTLLLCKYVELVCPLFWGFRRSKKKALSNQNNIKQGSIGFQVSKNKVYT